MVDANLVGDGSAAGTDTGSDDSSLGTRHEATDDCSADRRADYDLGPGVVAMIVGTLGRHRSSMAGGVVLGDTCDGSRQGSGKGEARDNLSEIHEAFLFPTA